MGVKRGAAPFKAAEWKKVREATRKHEVVEAVLDGKPQAFELVAPTGSQFLGLHKESTRRSWALQRMLDEVKGKGDDPSAYSDSQMDALLEARLSGIHFYMGLLRVVLPDAKELTDDDLIDLVRGTGGVESALAEKVYEVAGFRHPNTAGKGDEEALEDDLPLSSDKASG